MAATNVGSPCSSVFRHVTPLMLHISLRQSVHRLGGRPLGRVKETSTIKKNLHNNNKN